MDPIMGILASTMRATVGEIFSPSSNLTECAPPPLYQPFSVGQSLCCIKLVAHERQAYDNQTLLHTPGYCSACLPWLRVCWIRSQAAPYPGYVPPTQGVYQLGLPTMPLCSRRR